MFLPTFVAFSLLLFSSPAGNQSSSTESETLQSLLLEIRQLRQDVRNAAFTARRVQILIVRLHQQEAAVARASERVDEAKRGRAQVEGQKKYHAFQIKRYEQTRDRSADPMERKQCEDGILELQAQIAALSSAEQEAQANEIESTQQLQIEQAKLDQLEGELDRVTQP